MKRIILIGALFSCFCFLFLSSSSVSAAQPTEKSLLEAWESLQKNDPKTRVFEKLGEKRFRFKTEWFPFDGELIVVNVKINDRERASDGKVVVKLKDLPEDFIQEYSYNYSMWSRNNVLYFNKKTKKWMNAKEYFTGIQKKLKKHTRARASLFEYFVGNLDFIILFIALIFMIISWRKVAKKGEENVKRSLALAEETNRLLKEVLEELKKK